MFGEPSLFEPEAILHFKSVRQVAYSADGRLGVLDKDGNFRILDLNATQDIKALESTLPLQDRVAAFSFHLRGKLIVALRRKDEETAILLNYDDNNQLKQMLPSDTSTQPANPESQTTPPEKKETPTGIAYSPGGDLLAIAASDKKVYIFSDSTSGEGAKAHTLVLPKSPSGSESDRHSDATLPDAPATGLSFIQIGSVPQLVTLNTKGVWVWPSEDGPLREFNGDLTHSWLVRRVTVKPGTETDDTSPVGLGASALGLVLCIAPYDITNGAVVFRDKAAAWPGRTLQEPWEKIRLRLPDIPTCATCAPDGQLVAVGVKSSIYIFRGGEMLQRLDHNGKVNSIAFRPDAMALASASEDDTVRLWGLSSNGRLAMERQPVFAQIVALSPDGRWLASLDDHRIRLRDAATGKLEREAKVGDKPIASLAVNDDGHVFALAHKKNEAALWDVFSDGKARAWNAKKIFALSPNAKWAVCISDTSVLEMVDVDTGDCKPIVPLENAAAAGKAAVSQGNIADTFAISHSGRLIAAYDTSTKQITLYANPCLPAVSDATLDPHTPPIDLKSEARLTYLAFAPNERLLFTTTREGDLLLFDLKRRKQLFRREAGGPVTSLCTGGARSKLAYAITDQPVRIWGGAKPPDPAEKIANVTFNDLDLIRRSESEPSAQASAMNIADAAFWDTLWNTLKRIANLTGQSSADELEEAYAPMREVLAHREQPLFWQAAAMRQRLAVMPPWPPADIGALRARFDAVDELEPPERVILLRDGILPFARDDATIYAAARLRLAVERMDYREW
jgi:WD40 repeat protein